MLILEHSFLFELCLMHQLCGRPCLAHALVQANEIKVMISTKNLMQKLYKTRHQREHIMRY